MSEITLDTIERGMKATCGTVLRNEIYFCELDALAGDGDFGNSLAAGFRVIEADLPTLDKSTINGWLLKISMIISKHTGGSSGPLWGTAFMRAAMIAKDKSVLTLEDLEKIVQAAIEGIQARGGAQPGDKTLIDSLIPVRDAIAKHKADGDTSAALRDATKAAEEAAETAKAWTARRGRQQFTGDRSQGTPDPGMVAIATILNDLCTEFGVSR
ncbi:MAG: dihydroxyacetone kinase subunit DhaL [Caulobacteraceae bacterium]